MSEHATAVAASAPSFLTRHHFLLRRLHSLSGVVPVGLFVCFHLFTNMQMLFGTFQHEVDFIHNMPALLFVEVFGLWLPIAFHAALGIVYTFSGKSNVNRYKYVNNWRYTLQRITGILALIFIFIHIAKLRWGWTFGGLLNTPFYTRQYDAVSGQEIPLATASTALALQHAWWIVALYVIGVYSAVYHWANGLWTVAITWGLTMTEAAQRRWGYVCAAVGLSLAVFTAGSLYAGLTYKPTELEASLIARLKSGELKYMPHAPHGADHALPVSAPAPEAVKAGAPVPGADLTKH